MRGHGNRDIVEPFKWKVNMEIFESSRQRGGVFVPKERVC